MPKQHASIPQTSKKAVHFQDASFTGWGKGRATSVGEAADVTCTEHNHPQDQASNKPIEETGVLHKEGTIQS